MAYQGIIFGVLLSVTFCNYCRPVLSAVTENEVLERIAAIEDGQAICSRKNEMLEMKVKMLEKKNNELENRLRTQETVKIGMWSEIKVKIFKSASVQTYVFLLLKIFFFLKT